MKNGIIVTEKIQSEIKIENDFEKLLDSFFNKTDTTTLEIYFDGQGDTVQRIDVIPDIFNNVGMFLNGGFVENITAATAFEKITNIIENN